MCKKIIAPTVLMGIGTLIITIVIFFAQGGFVNMSPWYVIGLIVGISLILWGLWKDARAIKNKGSNVLTDDDKKYMARLNKELHNISDYYRELAGTINIKKIRKSKILEIDDRLNEYVGIIPIKAPKPPKKLNIFKAICILFFDLLKIMVFVTRVRFSKARLFKVYLDIGSIPDNVGIGLSLHDSKGEQLTKHLLRVVGERISSNETISAILRCKEACYAINNIYLWVLIYPKGHKKSRIDTKKVINTIYEYRDKIMAYAVADVNKAIIKEFLGY